MAREKELFNSNLDYSGGTILYAEDLNSEELKTKSKEEIDLLKKQFGVTSLERGAVVIGTSSKTIFSPYGLQFIPEKLRQDIEQKMRDFEYYLDQSIE